MKNWIINTNKPQFIWTIFFVKYVRKEAKVSHNISHRFKKDYYLNCIQGGDIEEFFCIYEVVRNLNNLGNSNVVCITFLALELEHSCVFKYKLLSFARDMLAKWWLTSIKVELSRVVWYNTCSNYISAISLRKSLVLWITF